MGTAPYTAQRNGPVVQPQPLTIDERLEWALIDTDADDPRPKRPNIVRQSKLCPPPEEMRGAEEAGRAAAAVLRLDRHGRSRISETDRAAVIAWLASIGERAADAAERHALPAAERSARRWAKRQVRRQRREEEQRQAAVTIA